jgi:hypothetical protein
MTSATPATTPAEPDLHITLPAQTARIVVDALDMYSRIGLGQLDEIVSLGRFGLLTNAKGEKPSADALEDAEYHLAQAKQALFGYAPNASHGIFSDKVAERFRTAWGALKAIRHRLAWDRTPTGGIQVSFDEPMREEMAAGVKVASGTADEVLAELPADMLLTRYGSGWAVVRLHPSERVLQVLADSHSPQTAIQKAKNVLSGQRPEGF